MTTELAGHPARACWRVEWPPDALRPAPALPGARRVAESVAACAP